MSELILSLGCVGGATGTYFACNALKDKHIRIGKKEVSLSNLIQWTLALLLFFAMIPYMFWLNAMSKQLGLSGTMFSKAGYVFIGILDWLTVMTVAMTIMMPFFSKREAHDYCAFLAIPILISSMGSATFASIYAIAKSNLFCFICTTPLFGLFI